MAKLERKSFCPLIKADCKQLDCSWFTQLRGTDPQSGEPVDEWGCAVTWLPMLLIETSKEVRQGAAATESFRNEMVDASQKAVQTQIALAGLKSLPQFLTIDQEQKS